MISKRSVSKKITNKNSVQAEETNVNECLKHLANGDIHLVNVETVIENIKIKPSLGDVLQYELHNYCKKNVNHDSGVSSVVKLAIFCYSSDIVSHFVSLTRFVGCLCHICSYLLKREKYEAAIIISHSLESKKAELIETSKPGSDILNFLYALHSHFITSATILTSQAENVTCLNYKHSKELAIRSLKFFQFSDSEQITCAKNVLKKSKAYLHAVKCYKIEDIVNFNEILRSVTKGVVSKFRNFDYGLFFLFKLDYIKSWDCSKGMELFQQLEKITQLFLILSDISTNAKECFSLLLQKFFLSPLDGTMEDCKLIQGCMDCNMDKGVPLFLMVSYIFHYGIQYWWKLFADDWNANISVSMINGLFTKMLDLHKQFYRNEAFYCASSNSFCDSCFGDLLIGNLHKIQCTIRFCLKNKVPNSFSIFPLSIEAFKLSLKTAEVMKEMGCDKMQRYCAWKPAVIHQTNLIEDLLKWSISNETWIYLRDSSQEILRQIVNSEFEAPYERKRVNILFQRWHQASLKLKDFRDALFVSVALYFSYPEEAEDCMSMWLQTKSECENEIFQEMTIIELLKICESILKEFNSKFDEKKIDTKAILLMELKAYSFCPNITFSESKIYNLIARIWKQLGKMTMDVWETSLVYKCLLSTNVSGEKNKVSEKFIDKCNSVVEKLSRWTFQEKLQCRSLAQAADLRLSLFLYNVRLVENSEGQMDATEMVLGYLKKAEEEKVKFGEDADLNLTCNIVPSSSQLTVNLETKYLIALKEIVRLWQKALESGFDVLPTSEEFAFWLRNVQLVANLYELFGEFHESLSTWHMFYKIGKLSKDSSSVLLGLSHLINSCSDANELDLLKESEEIADKLDSENRNDFASVVYLLTIASNHLKNKRPNECLVNLKKGRKVIERFRQTTQTHLLLGKFWCLVSQFLTLYPDREIEFGYGPGTDLRVIAYKAFYYVNMAARNYSNSVTRLESTELVLTMMEVDTWAFHFHEIYYQSDFMRYFLGDLYQIVQKLFLPTRTAEILVRLAEVDLICENSSDCQEKVNKLKTILTTLLAKSEKGEQEKSDRISSPERGGKLTGARETSPARFLKKPADSCQTKDVSPIHYQLIDMKNSNTIKHGVKCKCRLCQNILIQMLTMKTLALEGEIFRMENDFETGSKCYEEARKILSRLEILRVEKNEIFLVDLTDSMEIRSRQFDFLLGSVQFYSARFLIRYGLFQASKNNSVTKCMKNAMEMIDRLMKGFGYERKLLLWKFTELKMLNVVLTEGEPKFVPRGTPKEYRVPAIAKTPFPNRQPPPPVEPARKMAPRKKVSATVKNLKIDDSDGEDDNDSLKNQKNNPPSERKLFVHPRRLKFRTNEPPGTSETVKKGPNTRSRNIQPKKLELDFDKS